MAYSLDAFVQARNAAHAQGRQMTQEEFANIGGTASDFPLVYGGSTGQQPQPGQAPTQQPLATGFGGAAQPMQYGSTSLATGYTGAPSYANYGSNPTATTRPTYGATAVGAAPQAATQQALGGGSFGAPTSLSGMPNPQLGAPNAVAAQFGLNNINVAQQQQLNRVNEVNPYGSAQYVRNPDGSITRQYSLSAPQQALLNQQQSRDIALGDVAADSFYRLKNQYGQGLDLSQLGDAPSLDYSNLPALLGAQDMVGERQRTEDAVFDSFSRRNDPQFAREEEALYQSLADRGLSRDSERARIEIENMRQRQEDARLNAQNAARVAGLQELQGLFGLSSSARSQLAGEAGQQFTAGGLERDRALQELLLQRDRPASELSTLLGLQRGITNPEFAPISNINVPTVDAIGAGLGFSQQETQKAIAQLQAQTAAAQLAGNLGLGYAELAALNDYRQQQLAQDQNQFDLQYGNQPGFGDILLGAAGAGVGQGIGQGISGWFF